MKRCFIPSLADPKPTHRHWPNLAAAVGLWVLCASGPAWSQVASAAAVENSSIQRPFPAKAERGVLQVTESPEISLNGKPDRLSPGARVRDIDNRLVQPANITGVKFVVNYVRNGGGELQDVWILTEDESKMRLPTMPQKKGLFDFSKPEVKDDGNTPYNQLPKFK